VGGAQRVVDGRHGGRDPIAARYRASLERLTAAPA
jgi:hypothetical protein